MTRPAAFALLHGGGQGGWVWHEAAAALRGAGADVLVLDVPGCGAKRDRDTAALGVDEIADELIGEIAGWRDEVVLVGHSQGGTLLLPMAARRPDLFRRLIHLACCAPAPGQSVIDMMGRGVHGQHPDQVGWPLDPARHGSVEQRPILFCTDMGEPQAAAFLARLDRDRWPAGVTHAVDWRYDRPAGVPSSYIVCTRDGILPLVWQRRFAERLGVERLRSIDTGHQAMNTRPDLLAALLLADADTGADR